MNAFRKFSNQSLLSLFVFAERQQNLVCCLFENQRSRHSKHMPHLGSSSLDRGDTGNVDFLPPPPLYWWPDYVPKIEAFLCEPELPEHLMSQQSRNSHLSFQCALPRDMIMQRNLIKTKKFKKHQKKSPFVTATILSPDLQPWLCIQSLAMLKKNFRETTTDNLQIHTAVGWLLV